MFDSAVVSSLSEPVTRSGDDASTAPRAELRDPAATLRYVLAGQAIVTFQSEKTGTHFTYRITAVDKPAPTAPRARPVSHFVAVLTAPDQYTYLGCIYGAQAYAHGGKSRVGLDAPSARAFAWVWARLAHDKRMPGTLAVYHEGRCGRCGRRLTTPASVASGLGPECAKRAEGGS